jgi:hypothetical protein
MANISSRLNLTLLKHVRREMTGQNGKKIDVLIIPIDENNLYKGEKGVYLDLTSIEIKDKSKQQPGQKDTHLIKQSLPREVYDKLTDEQKNALPILGNTIDWSKVAPSEPQPQQSSELSSSAIDQYQDDKEDDLPF